MNEVKFKKRKTIEQVEESTELAPKFDKDGLIPVITTDFSSGEVLMQGYMNEEALKKTITLGEAVYYSRSRKTLWHKGKTSGLTQKIKADLTVAFISKECKLSINFLKQETEKAKADALPLYEALSHPINVSLFLVH